MLAASTGLQLTTLKDHVITPKEIPAPPALGEPQLMGRFLEEVPLKTKLEELITLQVIHICNLLFMILFHEFTYVTQQYCKCNLCPQEYGLLTLQQMEMSIVHTKCDG